ncbi:MAG TPA: acylphosphatase [Planctomycetaceae bacterium]|nr:acylphosphatase [Planctomycetaceae bacterium]
MAGQAESRLPDSPLKIIYSGRVQGVGFRWTTARIARQFVVRGTVRNLRDGTVELCVAGDADEIEAFLSELDRTMKHNIESREISKLPQPLPTEGFEIVH